MPAGAERRATMGDDVDIAGECAERGRRVRTAGEPRPHRLLRPAARAAAAAGRRRDERLDPLLPGARDDRGRDFAAIDASGLVHTRGQRAAGMTAAEWKLTSGDVDSRAVPCVFPSLTVTLNLTITLPRHETPDAPPADLQSRWERFAARVAAHEQRHVDIYLQGARAMTARLEGTRTAVSCADPEKAIDAEWRAQQADIERAQTEFHTEDETTARGEREALQARLDGTRAQLEPVDAEIRRLDTELADLRRRVEAGRADLVAQRVADVIAAWKKRPDSSRAARTPAKRRAADQPRRPARRAVSRAIRVKCCTTAESLSRRHASPSSILRPRARSWR
jgi:predicted secreted Zn-dependent protease